MSPTSQPFDLSVTVKLDASGNGTAQLGPTGAYMWKLGTIVVSTLSQSTLTIPQASYYAGSMVSPATLLDTTVNGNSDSSNRGVGQTLYQGQHVFAVWTGGITLDTATLRVTGQQVTGYRSAN